MESVDCMSKIGDWSDAELREFLEMVDAGRNEVTDWEAGFIESVLYKYTGPLSGAQRQSAFNIIRKYIEGV